jgi:hypothetical protein
MHRVRRVGVQPVSMIAHFLIILSSSSTSKQVCEAAHKRHRQAAGGSQLLEQPYAQKACFFAYRAGHTSS